RGRFGTVRGRRARPCEAARADRIPGEDWLPKTAAASHCITSYPVGSFILTHIPHACGEEATRMRPIYKTAVCSAHGWHGHHPFRTGRGDEPQRRRVVTSCCYAFITACSGTRPVVR